MLHTLTDSQRTLVETLGNAKAVWADRLEIAACGRQKKMARC